MKFINPKIQKLTLFVSLILLLFGSGCVSNSGASSDSSGGSSSGGSRTLKQVDLDVSPRVNTFRTVAAPSGRVTQSEQNRVNDAYARYRTAYNEALQAAGNNPNKPAPANVKALATQVIGAVESIP